jgi:hypothetical protein
MTALGEAVIPGSAFGGRSCHPRLAVGRFLQIVVIPGRDEVANPESMNTGV